MMSHVRPEKRSDGPSSWQQRDSASFSEDRKTGGGSLRHHQADEPDWNTLRMRRDPCNSAQNTHTHTYPSDAGTRTSVGAQFATEHTSTPPQMAHTHGSPPNGRTYTPNTNTDTSNTSRGRLISEEFQSIASSPNRPQPFSPPQHQRSLRSLSGSFGSNSVDMPPHPSPESHTFKRPVEAEDDGWGSDSSTGPVADSASTRPLISTPLLTSLSGIQSQGLAAEMKRSTSPPLLAQMRESMPRSGSGLSAFGSKATTPPKTPTRTKPSTPTKATTPTPSSPHPSSPSPPVVPRPSAPQDVPDTPTEPRVTQAWKPRVNRSLTRQDEMERAVKCLLNKLTIEKFGVITDKLARTLEPSLQKPEEVQQMVNIILEKAVTEPDWSEMYADLCQVLQWRSVSSEGEVETARRTPFILAMLSKVQEEYELMPRELRSEDIVVVAEDESAQIEALKLARTKKRILGVVKLIGELFQRKLLGFKIVNDVVVDLVINCKEPHEHFIECFLQLISTIGYYLDQNPKMKMVLDSWFGRLTELQKCQIYSKRVKCVIQDTLDMRKAQWRRKIHKERAKALNDLRDQLETEEVLGGSVHAAQYGNIVVVGERTNLNGQYAGFLNEQEQMYNRKMAKRMAASAQKK